MNMIVAASITLAQAIADTGSQPWQWDQSVPTCTLRQQLPTGDKIEITRTPANDETELTIGISGGPRVREGPLRDATIILGPHSKHIVDIQSGSDRLRKPELHLIALDPGFFENLQSASAIEISHPRLPHLHIPIRSISLAAEALRACEDRRMREWGIDPVAWRGLRARPFPLGDPRDGFTNFDYPIEAAASGVQGDAIARLDVGPDGKVQKCTTVNVLSHASFGRVACRVLKRARFRPALDSNGSSISAPILFDVKFRLANW